MEYPLTGRGTCAPLRTRLFGNLDEGFTPNHPRIIISEETPCYITRISLSLTWMGSWTNETSPIDISFASVVCESR
eukprot:1125048-Prorocentrum_minimum.AAC.3